MAEFERFARGAPDWPGAVCVVRELRGASASKSSLARDVALDQAWIRLIAAVLLEAARQAKKGNRSARRWLASDQAALFAEAIGLDTRSIHRFLRCKHGKTNDKSRRASSQR